MRGMDGKMKRMHGLVQHICDIGSSLRDLPDEELLCLGLVSDMVVG